MSRLDLPTFGPAHERDRGRGAGLGLRGDRRIPARRLGCERVGRGVLVGAVALVAVRSVAFLGFGHDERLQPARGDLVGPCLGLGLARLARQLLLGLGRQRPHDRVEQVAGPAAVRRGDRVRLLPAERVELHALELALLVVGLVHGHDDRGRGAAQQLGRLGVGGGHAGRGVDHQHDHVGLVDREPGLLLDPGLDGVVRVDLEAAGVDEHEASSVPLGVAVQPVTGRPRAVLDDGRPRADDPVEERALADVRTARRRRRPEARHRGASTRRSSLSAGSEARGDAPASHRSRATVRRRPRSVAR